MLFNEKIKPMLAFTSKPFNDKNFIFEIKFDGTRALAYIDRENKKVKFLNRRLKWFEFRYPELSEIYKSINAKKTILDGEIVVLEKGIPNFYKLANREQVNNKFRIKILAKTMPSTFIIFDILYLDGEDLTPLPLIKRKKILEKVVEENPNRHLLISRYIEEKGIEFFKEIKKKGYEGIIAKRKHSPYEIGKRSKKWLKIKVLNSIDAIICGYTKGEGKREKYFGALLLGVYEKQKLRYIGRVGTGFSENALRLIKRALEKIKIDKNPFDIFVEESNIIEKTIFVKPKYICEVEFSELTKDKKLRAPSFIRLREDKPLEECKFL
jgi:bifunctional non-homologous end joining protein LigD